MAGRFVLASAMSRSAWLLVRSAASGATAPVVTRASETFAIGNITCSLIHGTAVRAGNRQLRESFAFGNLTSSRIHGTAEILPAPRYFNSLQCSRAAAKVIQSKKRIVSNIMKASYSSHEPKKPHAQDGVSKLTSLAKAAVYDFSRWIYHHLRSAVPKLYQLALRGLKNIILDICGVTLILGIVSLGYYLSDKWKDLFGGDAKKDGDSPDASKQNLILKTKSVSVFFELGRQVLEEIKVVSKEVKDLKDAVKNLLDIETVRLVILRELVARFKKLEESAGDTEAALSDQMEELKRLREVLSEVKTQLDEED